MRVYDIDAYPLKTTRSSYITHVRVKAQSLLNLLAKEFALLPDVLEEVVLVDDRHISQSRRAGLWEVLKGVTVVESPIAWPTFKGIDDLVSEDHSRDLRIPSSKAFAHKLDVWYYHFRLPCMPVTGPSHSAHHLVKNEKYTMSVANFSHRFEVTADGRNTSERLLRDVSKCKCEC
jgi:hypothetical protein